MGSKDRDQQHHVMESEGRISVIPYSAEDLKLFTGNFSRSNFIGNTQYGKLYRGTIPNQTGGYTKVTVKIWYEHNVMTQPVDGNTWFKSEVFFLSHPTLNHRPNFPRLIASCPNLLGVVYRLSPIDTLHNLIVKDSFSWTQRIKVALGFARMLEFLQSHEPPYIVRNLDACHILIDQEFNPILSEFGMLTGGVMGDTVDHTQTAVYTILGYLDPYVATLGVWRETCDVYMYGVILVSIIAKRAVDKEHPGPGAWVDMWARKAYAGSRKWFSGNKKCSLVHKTLKKEPTYDVHDGCDITKLGMKCLEINPRLRPTIKDIVSVLQSLQIARLHGDAIGL